MTAKPQQKDEGSPVRSSRISDEILVALRRIMRATDVHSRRLLRQFGITGPQLLALRAVGQRGEMSSSTLARAISVSLPTATDIVQRLEVRRLVERRRSPADKRQVLVSITPTGRKVLGTAPSPLQESFTSQLEALPAWEQNQILSVLQRVVTMMEAEALDASPVLTTGELPEASAIGIDGPVTAAHPVATEPPGA